MSDAAFEAPVAFFIFKRPEQTRRVFEAIRQARPSRFFVVADGPRNSDELKLCDQTRAVVEQVDWPCEVATNYAPSNMGLRSRLASGISWVFEQAEEAIILEDDCLPHPTFFQFCGELLNRYRDDSKILHISANYFVKCSDSKNSYYFSQFPHIWGWATWRRAWRLYDSSLVKWKNLSTRRQFARNLQTRAERRFWQATLDAVLRGEIDTWDYQWSFAVMLERGLCINPTTNLVRNIGFGAEATHTKDAENILALLSADEVAFPLIHPKTMERDTFADGQTARMFFSKSRSWKVQLKRALGGLR